MFATLSPTTREFSRAHFRAAAARIEAAARSDAREYEYLLSSDLPPDFEALDALDASVTVRSIDRINNLAEVTCADFIII